MAWKFDKQYRLPDCDYCENGAYFITICTKNRQHFFGKIEDQKINLSVIGKIVEEEWLKTPKIRPYVILNEWVIMPNHFHGIIIIDKPDRRNEVPPRSYIGPHPYFSQISPQPDSLSSIIGSFKLIVTKRCHRQGFAYFSWQERFYDRIIRQEEGLETIQEYIKSNPINWESDRNNFEDL